MAHHELKTDQAVFKSTWDETKTFEIRKNDRDFSTGDRLVLRETEHSGDQMRDGSPLEYTGRAVTQIVNYVLRGPIYGLEEGWVILSVEGEDYDDNYRQVS